MKQITLKAYAKINLSLDVLGLLTNGYHQVEMIMQQVELHDKVTVAWEESEAAQIRITSDREDIVPLDSTNLAYKAAAMMLEAAGTAGKVDIHIEKNIPVAAGLAGGSSNGAAVMLALNHLMQTGHSLEKLCGMGVKLGADVPFCIMGQARGNKNLDREITENRLAASCALAEGIGEKLTPLEPLRCEVLLSKPTIGVSTAEVYRGIDGALGFVRPAGQGEVKLEHHIKTEELIEGIRSGDLSKITANMQNMLEIFTLKRYPIVMYTKDKIEKQNHADKVLMSGSGPTVFAVYFSEGGINEDYRALKTVNDETFITKTLI
ncbi:MAG: 4-(cytidine 5'-diphospho)-2-C-methyl-D-erythritol kinase [Anaerovoracaceae bacterium]